MTMLYDSGSCKSQATSQSSKKSLAEQMGWLLRRKLGEGHTRVVYEALRPRGDVYERAVVKIPKNCSDSESVQTKINSLKLRVNNESESYFLRKLLDTRFDSVYIKKLIENDFFGAGDSDLNLESYVEVASRKSYVDSVWLETMLGMQVSHTLRDDTFCEPLCLESVLFEDGSVVESYFDGLDLETHVKIYGPMRNHAEILNLCDKLIRGVDRLYLRYDLIHRDIKPSNVLLSKTGNAIKIIDLQNAKNEHSSTESIIPTRGGTRYCDPFLLKSFLNGEPSQATIDSDFFSVGATLYYALTGKNLFDFELVYDANGLSLQVGNETISVSIHSNGNKLKDIDVIDCYETIMEKIQEVPRQYRRMLGVLLWLKKSERPLVPTLVHEELNLVTFPNNKKCPYTEGALAGTGIIPDIDGLKAYLAQCEGLPCNDNPEKFIVPEFVSNGESILYDSIVDYAKRKGQLSYGYFSADDSHGSQTKTKLKGRQYTLQNGSIDIRITEFSNLLVNGIENASWSEKHWRHLNIFNFGESVFSGKKLLREEYCEGGVGNLSTKVQEEGIWEITATHPLEKVVGYLFT